MNRAAATFGRRTQAFVLDASFEPMADDGATSRVADDLKLFALTWLGGLIFFGTYLS